MKYVKQPFRESLKALGMELLVEDEFASPTVTAFVPKKDEVKTIKMNYLIDSTLQLQVSTAS